MLSDCGCFRFHSKTRESLGLTLCLYNSITTWDELANQFLQRFFPSSKTSKLRNEIMTFAQFDSEAFYDSWERFQDLLMKCPQHGLPEWLQLQSLYQGLTPEK